MNSIVAKIPIMRFIVRSLERKRFEREWRKQNVHNETKVGARQFALGLVTVGKGTYGTINIQNMYAQPKDRISIGNYVSIAPDVIFLSGVNHQIDTVTTFPFYSKLIQRSSLDALSNGPIVVEDEVWLGTGSMIFSGVTIGKGAIVAAGALVTKDVQPYAIVGGNPAKLIRYRFPQEVIDILLPIRFVDLSSEWITENIETVYKKIESVNDALIFQRLVENHLQKKK